MNKFLFVSRYGAKIKLQTEISPDHPPGLLKYEFLIINNSILNIRSTLKHIASIKKWWMCNISIMESEERMWEICCFFNVCLIDAGYCDSFPLMENSALCKDSQPSGLPGSAEMTRKFMETFQRGWSRDEVNNQNGRLWETREAFRVS